MEELKMLSAEEASVVFCGVLNNIRYLNLPINCCSECFDKINNPLILYSCVVWGNKNLDIISK